MKREFICLAKSEKYKGRCIAGVEIAREGGRLSVLMKQENPKWIRPITSSEHDEVDESIGSKLNLLGIYQIKGCTEKPVGIQSENCSYEEPNYTRTGQVGLSLDNLSYLVDNDLQGKLLGNSWNYIDLDQEHLHQRSICLVKVTRPQVRIKIYKEKRKYRISFFYNKQYYSDIPVTDPDFKKAFDNNPQLIELAQHCYLTISLAQEFKNRYYKIVAAVILL